MNIYFLKSFLEVFLAVLGLHCLDGFSLAMASGGYSLVEWAGFLLLWLLLLLSTSPRACRL